MTAGASPEWAESGVDLQPCVGLRGDRLWVGEPGPLSPEERERLREDRLRLVWSSDACLVIFLKSDVLFLLGRQGDAQRPRPQRSAPPTHLSWPSLVLTFLLRLAILDLWPVFRAGPSLMDVFSKAVAEMETLAPLCS